MTPATRRLALSAAVLVAAAAFVWSLGKSGTAAPPPETGLSVGSVGSWSNPVPATDEDLRLIAPWRIGTMVDSFRIVAVFPGYNGFFWVILARGGSPVYLQIARSGGGPTPMATAGPYAIYSPGPSEATGVERQALADRLSAVLSTNNASVPVPPGLATFHPTEGLPVPSNR